MDGGNDGEQTRGGGSKTQKGWARRDASLFRWCAIEWHTIRRWFDRLAEIPHAHQRLGLLQFLRGLELFGRQVSLLGVLLPD